MKFFDIALFTITIIAVSVILLLVQSISRPLLFEFITSLGFFENSKEGIKDMFISILAFSSMTFVLILVLAIRVLMRLYKK